MNNVKFSTSKLGFRYFSDSESTANKLIESQVKKIEPIHEYQLIEKFPDIIPTKKMVAKEYNISREEAGQLINEVYGEKSKRMIRGKK